MSKSTKLFLFKCIKHIPDYTYIQPILQRNEEKMSAVYFLKNKVERKYVRKRSYSRSPNERTRHHF